MESEDTRTQIRQDRSGRSSPPAVATIDQLRAAVISAYGPTTPSSVEERVVGKITGQDQCAQTYTRVSIGGEIARRFFDPRLLWKSILDADAQVVGEVAQPSSAVVVSVQKKGQPPLWLEFDKTTNLLDGAILMWETGVPTMFVFSDYRRAGGSPTPWQVSETEKNSTVVDEIQSDTMDSKPAAADLEIPQTRRLLEFPPNADRVELPVRFSYNDVIVRVNIEERGLDVLLDSGTSGIVIDGTVAAQLGLRKFGRMYAAPGGWYDHLFLEAPEVAIGPLRMHDVALLSLPFSFQGDPTTRYVGLLGFDFLAGAVIQLDYHDAKLAAIRSDRFQPPSDASPITLRLDDGVPMVSAMISGHNAEDILVDTGSDTPIVYSRFVQEAGWPTPNPETTVKAVLYYPLYGIVRCNAVRFSYVQLGNYYFRDMLGYITFASPKFEAPDTDGLIGANLLNYFTVFFDYPESKMYLQPNALFQQTAK